MLSKNFSISPTATGVTREEVKRIYHLMNQLDHSLSNSSLTNEMKKVYCSLLESYSLKIFELLDYSNDLIEQKASRNNALRVANDKIRDLEDQLGNKVSDIDIMMGTGVMFKNINSWWDMQGFESFMPIKIIPHHQVEVKLSLNIKSSSLAFYEKDYLSPEEIDTENVERNKNYEAMNNKYDIIGNDLLMTENNIVIIKKLILDKYPSAIFIDIDSVFLSNQVSIFKMNSIEFIINYSNISLPSIR
jgi:hypothetical protein